MDGNNNNHGKELHHHDSAAAGAAVAVDSTINSPVHFGLQGHFSADDLHALLGDWHHGEEEEQHDGKTLSVAESKGEDTTSDSADIPEDCKAQARSERKRSREKQRRNDVNRQFAELTECLKKIELEESQLKLGDNGAAPAAPVPKMPPFSSPANRVDLIARTIAHLERLHHLHKTSQDKINGLEQQLDAAKKAGEDTAQKLKEAIFQNGPGGGMQKQNIMMMVPMMIPAGGQGGAMAMPMPMNPFMQHPPQQPFIMQQTPPQGSAVAPASASAGAPAIGEPKNDSAGTPDPHSGNSTPQPQQQSVAMQMPMMMAPQMMGMGGGMGMHMMMQPVQQPHSSQDQQQQQPVMMPLAYDMGQQGTQQQPQPLIYAVPQQQQQSHASLDGSLQSHGSQNDSDSNGNLAHAA